MSVEVTFKCDGCDNKSNAIRLDSKFIGINGKSYGFGTRQYEQPKDKAPEGWIAYDLIGCTYCPTCAENL